jgi:hypothetical protein
LLSLCSSDDDDDDDDETVCDTAAMILNGEAEVLRENPPSALFIHHRYHKD